MMKAHLGMGTKVRLATVAVAMTLLGSLPAMGTNLFWSANGTTQGGAGTWNTTTANRWGTTAAGPFDMTWNNANADSAEFGGTTGQINLGGPITVNLITTNSLGFNIGNGNAAGATNTINFTGANAGVFTNYASGSTTLSAVIGANSVVNKTGTGRMEMGNGTNPNSVKYVLKGGAMTTASIARASGTAPGALVQDFWTFDGGGWGINTGNQDTGTNRGITIKSGGAFFGASATTLNVTISSPIVGTEGGGITVTNVGPFVGNSHQSGVLLILNNGTATPNSWDGGVTIASGTVREALNNQVPDTAIITQSAGTQFDLGTVGVTDSVKSISGTGGTIALGAAGKLTVLSPAGESAQQVLTGTAGSQLIKEGSGALSLTGSSTGFAGEILLNNGTIGIGGVNCLGSNTANPIFQINGGNISNTTASGRSMSANLKVNLNANFTADDSLAATQGQITFNGVSTIVGGNRTVTVNGTANIAFADLREDVAGRQLIKNGNGTLALTGTAPPDAAVFTGSVTVNAGRLQVSGGSIVGNESNPVILAGGALNTSATRTVNFANPISVTANSAITTTSTAATPNFDFSNDNPLTFTGGTVLTLRNDGGDAATDQFRVRLFGGGFNIANSIDMPNGAASSTTELSSFNTSSQAAQTFSGVITGTGDFKRSASIGGTGGTTIMMAQHTFTGGTKLNDGTIEFAVDSVGPANAPTSGPVGTGTITVDNINSPKLAANGGARNVGNSIAFVGGSVMGITGSNDLTLTGDVNLGAGARTINVDNSGLSLLSGTISGTGGSLTKALGGVLTVTGNNTYDTGTTVGAGTLLVNNTTGSGTGTGAVTVNSGATLGGTGTVGGAITNNGAIAPGASVGTLSVTGDVLDAAGSNWAIELSGASADKLAVTGNIDLTAADSLVVTGAGSGSSWLIGTYTGILSGVFDTITSGYTVDYSGGNITLNAAVAGLPGDFNSDGKVDAGDYATWRKNDGTNNALANDNGLGTPIGAAHYNLWRANFGNPPGAGSGGGLGGAAVPEPSTIVLVAMGLLAVVFRRRG